jgi:hypothetical protein
MEKLNPAYQYALLVMLSILLNLILNYDGNVLYMMIGLGFFIVIYILDKILKKL